MAESKEARYCREAMRRVARAEADCNATVLRAFDRVLTVLYREVTEARIRLDRKNKRVTSRRRKST